MFLLLRLGRDGAGYFETVPLQTIYSYGCELNLNILRIGGLWGHVLTWMVGQTGSS